MAQELIYTSAPRGLFPGSSGFCTVQMTDGLPRPAVELLEGFSNHYKPAPGHPGGGPPAVSFVRAKAGATAVRVLSRNNEAPADYTGRSNNLAHHIILDAEDQQRASNPAALAMTPNLFVTRWDGSVKTLPPKNLPTAAGWSGEARRWQTLAGDSGWAMAVAETWMAGDGPLYLIHEPGVELLPLLAEAIEQLPPGRRADATFTTYHTGLPLGIGCLVRGVLVGTEHEAVARKARHLVLHELVGRRPPVAGRPLEVAAVGGTPPSGDLYGMGPGSGEEPYGLSGNGPPLPPSKRGEVPPPAAPRVPRRDREFDAPPRPGPSKVLLAGLLASVLVNAGLGAMYMLSASATTDVAGAAQKQREAEAAREAAEKEQQKAEEAKRLADETALKAENAAADARKTADDSRQAASRSDGTLAGERKRWVEEKKALEGNLSKTTGENEALRAEIERLKKQKDPGKPPPAGQAIPFPELSDVKPGKLKIAVDSKMSHVAKVSMDGKRVRIDLLFTANPPLPPDRNDILKPVTLNDHGVPVLNRDGPSFDYNAGEKKYEVKVVLPPELKPVPEKGKDEKDADFEERKKKAWREYTDAALKQLRTVLVARLSKFPPDMGEKDAAKALLYKFD